MVATRAVWREDLRGLLMVVWLVDTMAVLKAESMAKVKVHYSVALKAPLRENLRVAETAELRAGAMDMKKVGLMVHY